MSRGWYREDYRYGLGTGQIQKRLKALFRGWSGREKATGIAWGLVRYREGCRHCPGAGQVQKGLKVFSRDW